MLSDVSALTSDFSLVLHPTKKSFNICYGYIVCSLQGTLKQLIQLITLICCLVQWNFLVYFVMGVIKI